MEYFLGEDDTEYFICEKGWVLEGRHFEDGEPNLDKAIMPTVQGNRAYIRVRRKGLDKKYQLIRIFNELFADLFKTDIVIETKKGLWTLSGETRRGSKTQESASKKKAKKEPVAKQRAVKAEQELPVEEPQDVDQDILVKEIHDVRACKVCNLKKRVQEFSPRDDMCLDCYQGRDELLKEIISKRKKAKEKQARFMREASEDSDEKIDSLGNINYDISVSD